MHVSAARTNKLLDSYVVLPKAPKRLSCSSHDESSVGCRINMGHNETLSGAF